MSDPRVRFLLASLFAIVASVLGVLLWLSPRLERQAEDRAYATALAEARLTARLVTEALEANQRDRLGGLVSEASADSRTRVSVVAADGQVLADSSLGAEALARLENHKDRPEIADALAGREGRARRLSTSVGEAMLYAAAPVLSGGRVLAVARVARPIADIEAETRRLRRAVAAAVLAAAALVGAVGMLTSLRFSRSLSEVVRGAREFAHGNLAARIVVDRQDELGDLASHLNKMANELDARLSDTAEEKKRTETILQAMEEGLLAVDARGVVVLANESLVAGLGIPNPVGRHYIEAIRHREIDEVVRKVLAFGQRETAEMDVAHFKRSFAVTGLPLSRRGGAILGAIVTFHDVTHARRVESIRRDFVANASHELRTPLTSIRGFVEALEDGALDEPNTAQRFLGRIRSQADRMAELIEDLLALSKLESEAQTAHLERADVARVARSVVSSFAERAGMRRIDLSVRQGPDVAAVCDVERLRRILENLLDNAVKYTPGGGSVEVVVSAQPRGAATIDVVDTGIGIPPEHASRVFERFYRVDKSRSRDLGGTGLGLAIVKHLAETMGATVSVTSESGKGSTFRVTLRAEPAPDSEAT